jgi:hypothetical protein
MTQKFKGDALELKMISAGEPVFDLTNLALDEFYANGFDCAPFLLKLYDDKRMPFSNRIPRAAFVEFIREALRNFPVTGTFESYIFVLKSIFGPDTGIFFDVPAGGKLEIDIEAVANTEFDFIGRVFSEGEYEFFNVVDYDGSILTFRGVPGISSEYELNLLFSEIMPGGIVPTILLEFITRYDWISEEAGEFSEMTDHLDNQIIFYEVG